MSVSSIGEYAFCNCRELTSITINSEASISSYAFKDCSGLTSVTIGNSVTSIGSNAFYGCTSLSTIYCTCYNPPIIDYNTFHGCYNATLIVRPGLINLYQSDDRWNNFSTIKEGFIPGEDKQPLSISLKNVPNYVSLGSTISDIVANIKGIVDFEDGIMKEVKATDMQFQVSPDIYQTGEKTLTAVYDKTYNGENCSIPVIGYATFEVVEFNFILGATDNSTPWWGSHSENVKVEPGESITTNFINYTNGANRWNNFVVVLCKADNSEYAVVRADNYGWGDGYGNPNMTTSGDQSDWGEWLAAMNGAKVTTTITNNGDGSADVVAIMKGNNGVEYVQEYRGIAVDDPNDFYFRFTVDGCHLVFE